MKNLVFALLLGFGFLSQGFSGINPEKAAELNLPFMYYFREAAYPGLNLGCEGSDCPVQDNYVLNQAVTGLNQ